jgi:sugar (pentulose or hexulose) kinase
MKQAGVDFRSISAIAGAGQQHGSVYWSNEAETLLSSLDSAQPLISSLVPGAFSMPNAPIWQDSSTTRECRELEESVGGPQVLADLTGSRAYERFTGNQIAKVALMSHFSLVNTRIDPPPICRGILFYLQNILSFLIRPFPFPGSHRSY